ncbi:MAG: DUF3201 domain-containing protein [Asgard group archaeon]|nr:DUF3201 domain-containing protein [Asgard group archaeon]
MKELKEFLDKNKEQIHEILNHMWQTIEKILFRLEEKLPEIDLDNTHGNFVTIDEGWAEAYYANPTITFPYGEIGYSLDGLYCVFTILEKELKEDHYIKLLEIPQENDGISLEIYGGDDCFTTFYHSKDEGDLDEIIDQIKKSSEKIIQIEIAIEALPEEDLKEQFLTIIIKLYNFFLKENLLAKLSFYDEVENDAEKK